jgi:hypothetical protein
VFIVKLCAQFKEQYDKVLNSQPTRELWIYVSGRKKRNFFIMAETSGTCHTSEAKYIRMILIFPPTQIMFKPDVE